MHVPNIEALSPLITDFPEPLRKIADAFWPGPLTLLLPRSKSIPDLTCAGLPRAAFRIPEHPIALALLKECSLPLAAPSANPFGYISPTTAMHVAAQLGDAIPYILDGGPCRIGLESTIVGMEKNNIVVYRLGGIALSEIESVAGECKLLANESSNPRAPGMLKSHYAPHKKLLLGNLDELLIANLERQPILIVFGPFRNDYPEAMQLNLSAAGDVNEAAANLFSQLRKADEAAQTLILAELIPSGGLGSAINDRLRRAAAN